MHRKIKICIITHTHLCRNPRVVKEATALYDAGYEVFIVNSIYSKLLLAEDLRLIGVRKIILRHASNLSINNYRAFADRFKKKIGTLFLKFFRQETKYALGYAPDRYLKISKSVSADLYICHQELPTYIGVNLLKQGFRVGFDFEDWYSEDLPIVQRKKRPLELLRNIERTALQNGLFSITTSKIMAKKLSEKYKSKIPEVIYNSFDIEKRESKSNINRNTIRLIWFSLYIGENRGLEEFMKVMNELVTPMELHLVGEVSDSFRKKLENDISSRHKLKFIGMLPTYELDKCISNYDIGLALDLNDTLNRDLTITNKFFQYIQNGLPIIATNTEGHREIFHKFDLGIMIDYDLIDYFKLNSWLSNNARRDLHLNDIIEANAFYNWRNNIPTLLRLVENGIKYKESHPTN